LFLSSSSISLNLMVSSRMLSLSTSSSEMVVNLMDVLILLFYFLTSSSYFCMFLRTILSELDSLDLTLISLLEIIFSFWGSSSSIFCRRTISF